MEKRPRREIRRSTRRKQQQIEGETGRVCKENPRFFQEQRGRNEARAALWLRRARMRRQKSDFQGTGPAKPGGRYEVKILGWVSFPQAAAQRFRQIGALGHLTGCGKLARHEKNVPGRPMG